MTVGERIKIARQCRNLTQKELGDRVGLSDDRIRHYEINKRTPREDWLKKIAAALDFPIEFFASRELNSHNDVIQTFNVLEEKFGVSMKKGGTVSGKRVYNITIDDRLLDKQIEAWLDGEEEILSQIAADSGKTAEEIEKEKQLWKYRYPLSHADKSQAKLKEARKNNRSESPND